MAEETRVDLETTGEPETFEVGELSDESLDAVAGGLTLEDNNETAASPGNSCINNVANC